MKTYLMCKSEKWTEVCGKSENALCKFTEKLAKLERKFSMVNC